MKNIILIGITGIFITACGSSESSSKLDEMTNTFKSFNQQFLDCSTGTVCRKLSLDYNTYINHPDNQETLYKCEKDSDCYEAMMTLANNLITNLSKVGLDG